MKNYKLAGALLLSVVLGWHSVEAQTLITVPNFSFESPVIGGGNVVFSAPNNWTVTGAEFLISGGGGDGFSTPLPAPADGVQGMGFYSPGTGTTSASLGTITGSTTYTLTVAVGARSTTAFMASYGIELLANGVALTPTSSSTPTPSSGAFVNNSETFNISSGASVIGDAMTIELTGAGGGGQVVFDNVQLSYVTTPEPRAGLMMLGGIALLAGVLCLRKQTI